MQKRWVVIIINILILFYFSLFFAHKISLPTADLGRHITNGKIFLQTGKILSTNYYSYTQPDFPFVNHHWLSGVIFYLVYKLCGFTGLSIFYVLLSGTGIFLFYKAAKMKSSTFIALLCIILLLPIMANRKEIRPEGISYFFMGLYFYLLTLFIDKKLKQKFLFIIILISQLIWVNSHLFFIMGNFIILCFAFNEAVNLFLYKKNNFFKPLVFLVIFSFLISLINPYFIKGLIEPFNILKEYGYMIIENQSVFFMQKRAPGFNYFYFEITTIASVILILYFFITKNLKNNIPVLIITFIYMILAYKAIRMMPVFAFFFAVLSANFLAKYVKLNTGVYRILCIFIIIFTFIPGNFFSIFKNGFGIGLSDQSSKAGEFYVKNNLKGPIFNNYDIGGYLIFYLDGKEKVFVDNRPEAYSVEFFTKTYVPMQEDENVWREIDSKYNFNSIFFYRRDATPWAQPFLIKRLQDQNWVPVYVDDYSLILVKSNDANWDIINKYKLPKGMFIVT